MTELPVVRALRFLRLCGAGAPFRPLPPILPEQPAFGAGEFPSTQPGHNSPGETESIGNDRHPVKPNPPGHRPWQGRTERGGARRGRRLQLLPCQSNAIPLPVPAREDRLPSARQLLPREPGGRVLVQRVAIQTFAGNSNLFSELGRIFAASLGRERGVSRILGAVREVARERDLRAATTFS
jgi:hypothetical protein